MTTTPSRLLNCAAHCSSKALSLGTVLRPCPSWETKNHIRCSELSHVWYLRRRDALLAQDAEMEMAKRRKVNFVRSISRLLSLPTRALACI